MSLGPRFFFCVALLLYATGLWSGLPHASAADRIRPWNPDELAPLGAIAELYSVFHHSPKFNPQYPLFHYVIQAVFVGPYLIGLSLTGRLSEPSVEYPYGLTDPVSALATMTVLARSVSWWMAAAVVATACRTATLLWDRSTGTIAGVMVLLTYPMFYYARVSTVDMGALFWTSLGLYVFAVCVREGVTRRRAMALAVFAALATATKDMSYAAFLPVGLAAAVQYLREPGSGGRRRAWGDLSAALAASAAAYALASGLVFHPARYLGHLSFITGSHEVPDAFFASDGVTPAIAEGYLGLLHGTWVQLLNSLGAPVAMLGVAGVLLCAVRSPRNLVLALPALGVLLGVIVPARLVYLRYVLVMAYVAAIFAAHALATALGSERRGLRGAARLGLTLACAWSLLRGGDLTYQMIHDSRYAVGAWFAENARPGDRIGFYGAWDKFPPLASTLETVPMPGQIKYLAGPPAAPDFQPEFILVMGQHPGASHEYTLPRESYRRLLDGSSGYELVLEVHTRSLLGERLFENVNPVVKVFARKDR